MRRRTFAGSVATSWPATSAVPPVGRSRVTSIRTVVVFPSVWAEEPVHLALGDLEVDAVDGLDAALELPLQPANLDGAHARSLFVGARGDRARRYFGSGMPMGGSTPGPKTASSAVILTRCFPRV